MDEDPPMEQEAHAWSLLGQTAVKRKIFTDFHQQNMICHASLFLLQTSKCYETLPLGIPRPLQSAF